MRRDFIYLGRMYLLFPYESLNKYLQLPPEIGQENHSSFRLNVNRIDLLDLLGYLASGCANPVLNLVSYFVLADSKLCFRSHPFIISILWSMCRYFLAFWNFSQIAVISQCHRLIYSLIREIEVRIWHTLLNFPLYLFSFRAQIFIPFLGESFLFLASTPHLPVNSSSEASGKTLV